MINSAELEEYTKRIQYLFLNDTHERFCDIFVIIRTVYAHGHRDGFNLCKERITAEIKEG